MIFLLSVFFLTLHCRLDCSRDRIRFQNVCCLTGVKDVEKSDIEIEVVWSSSTAATVCSLKRNGSCSQPCKHNFNVKTFCWRSFKQTHTLGNVSLHFIILLFDNVLGKQARQKLLSTSKKNTRLEENSTAKTLKERFFFKPCFHFESKST